MLAQNGARASSRYAGGVILTWLGTDVTKTSDGTPNANAKGDPGGSNFGTGLGTVSSAAGILQEENGIRMIPDPFSGNQPESWMVDPRFTSQGINGHNL